MDWRPDTLRALLDELRLPYQIAPDRPRLASVCIGTVEESILLTVQACTGTLVVSDLDLATIEPTEDVLDTINRLNQSWDLYDLVLESRVNRLVAKIACPMTEEVRPTADFLRWALCQLWDDRDRLATLRLPEPLAVPPGDRPGLYEVGMGFELAGYRLEEVDDYLQLIPPGPPAVLDIRVEGPFLHLRSRPVMAAWRADREHKEVMLRVGGRLPSGSVAWDDGLPYWRWSLPLDWIDGSTFPKIAVDHAAFALSQIGFAERRIRGAA